MILTCETSKPTRSVCIRDVTLGGQAPIRVQTMVKQPTTNPAKVLNEIRRTACVNPRDLGEREILVLKELNLWEDALRCGPFRCDITRVSVPDRDSVEPFGEIVAGSPLPVVADIHFHASLALAAMERVLRSSESSRA